MTKKPKKDTKYQAHIYMERDEYELLKQIAERELRSINTQAMYYIKRGLEADKG